MKTIHYLCIAIMSLISITMMAQKTIKSPANQKTTLLLPDGRELAPNKLDSLEKAWGKDKIIFMHTEDDFEKGIVRLLRKTDEDVKRDKLREQAALSQKALLNQPAPQFELTDLNGKRWSLNQLRGKKIVLNFWFSSCAPCLEEMPRLNKLVEEYKGKDVVFLGITFNNPQQVHKFLEKHTFKYTLLPNSKEIDKLYKISGWPVNMVIDSKGVIRLIEGYSPDIHTRIKKSLDTIK